MLKGERMNKVPKEPGSETPERGTTGEPHSILGQGIIMLCSATAVILTVISAVLGGLLIGESGSVEGRYLLFGATVSFMLSFAAGLFAYFTLVSAAYEKRDIYEKAIEIPVMVQQILMGIGLILVTCFIYKILF